jgi:ketosteroid isomerase-like protein
MRKLLSCAVVLLAGCATDEVTLRPLPAAGEPSTEVTVIRPRATVQAEWPFYIVVAHQPVFDLRNGENTRFRMSAGRQTLVIRCLGGPVSKPLETSIEQDLPPRGSAYFLVEPKFDCAGIRALDPREAGSQLATTRFRAVGTVDPMAQAHGDAPAVFSSQPVPAPPPPATANQRVAAATAAWIEAFNSRDVARIASFYDSDAVLRDASGQRLAAGPGGIAEYFRSTKAPATASIGEQEIRVFGDTAVDAGASTLGRYNIVYRNRDGRWLIIDQTWLSR